MKPTRLTLHNFAGIRPGRILMLALCVPILTGCWRTPEYSGADNKALCDPATKQAWLVTPGEGQISFVKRATQFDVLCVR